MKCYKRLLCKQFVQVSGLMHLCRVFYGDAILVYCFSAQIWPPEINKNIWSSLFLIKLFLFTQELAYVPINKSSNTWNGYTCTAENQEERLFSTRQHPYFGVTHCENLEVQFAFFKMNHAMGMETSTKIYFLFIFNLV